MGPSETEGTEEIGKLHKTSSSISESHLIRHLQPARIKGSEKTSILNNKELYLNIGKTSDSTRVNQVLVIQGGSK